MTSSEAFFSRLKSTARKTARNRVFSKLLGYRFSFSLPGSASPD